MLPGILTADNDWQLTMPAFTRIPWELPQPLKRLCSLCKWSRFHQSQHSQLADSSKQMQQLWWKGTSFLTWFHVSSQTDLYMFSSTPWDYFIYERNKMTSIKCKCLSSKEFNYNFSKAAHLHLDQYLRNRWKKRSLHLTSYHILGKLLEQHMYSEILLTSVLFSVEFLSSLSA